MFDGVLFLLTIGKFEKGRPSRSRCTNPTSSPTFFWQIFAKDATILITVNTLINPFEVNGNYDTIKCYF